MCKYFSEDELHFAKSRLHTCSQCGIKYPSLKELRTHKALAHSLPTCSNGKTSYSRLVTARSIKKEEKLDENVLESKLSNFYFQLAVARDFIRNFI